VVEQIHFRSSSTLIHPQFNPIFKAGSIFLCTYKVDSSDFSSLTASLPVGKVALLVTWSGHQVDALIAHE
jgi:hypothetical protein